MRARGLKAGDPGTLGRKKRCLARKKYRDEISQRSSTQYGQSKARGRGGHGRKNTLAKNESMLKNSGSFSKKKGRIEQSERGQAIALTTSKAHAVGPCGYAIAGVSSEGGLSRCEVSLLTGMD